VNFDNLVSSLDRFGYRGMIKAIQDTIEHLERAPAAATRTEFLGRARRLVGWLKTGIHPEALDERDRRAYIRVAAKLVERGEFSSSVLDHLSAMPVDSATADSAALAGTSQQPRRSRRAARRA
jgi:hypothetical protein